METDPLDFSLTEVTLSSRNHALLLEALRYPVTPVGMHYLLTHFDVPEIDPASFRLEIDGLVEHPLSLGLDDLRARPAVERVVTIECAGNGRATVSPRPRTQPWVLGAVATASWKGTPLAPILADAGVSPEAVEIVFTGADHGIEGGIEQDYQRSLPVAEACEGEALLVYEMNGLPLLPQHGAPLRLVVPGWYGMASVKWLGRITAIPARFEGYYQVQAYCVRKEKGERGEQLHRMLPRALMIPPGIPEFPSRRRHLDAGPCLLEGRAWTGSGRIESVDVSTDGGVSWSPAALDPPVAPGAWARWEATWEASAPGDYVLCCRATADDGRTQPLDAVWNLGGYANNAIQRIPVTVRG